MAAYEVFFKQSVWKELRRIPKKYLSRVMDRINQLGSDPRPPGCEKLSGEERYRIRQGKYRIVYEVHDALLMVWVVKVGHRRDVYR